jgi:23S rRNA G2445 N2-methylase RlmL
LTPAPSLPGTRFFVTAAKGTEPALRDELRELRFRRVRADRGGVHFEGDMADAARACLWSRVGLRVLRELAAFDAASEGALYDGARAVDWSEWVTPETTIAVRASCRSSRLTHSQFIAQKTKDAIVDRLRDETGARPSVDREAPDVGVAVHLAKDRAVLYLDASGASLHERGWRSHGGAAPLRETLAAAVLRLAGWNRSDPLLDPMCGAGTIAIEAAAWSRGIAPGLARPQFGFERWAGQDARLRERVRALRDEARAAAHEGAEVFASDVDPNALEAARANAHAAGVPLALERRDMRALRRPRLAPFVVTNPPYGERIAGGEALYRDLADAMRRIEPKGVAVLAGTPAIAQAFHRAADRYWILFNGPIECRLLVFD